MRTGKDNYLAIILRSIVPVLAFYQPLRIRRLKSLVLTGDGKTENRPIGHRTNPSIHLQDDLPVLNLHFLIHGWFPINLAFETILRSQCPARNTFAYRNLELRMIPRTALIKATGEADIFIASLIEIQKCLILRFADVYAVISHHFEIIIPRLRLSGRT